MSFPGGGSLPPIHGTINAVHTSTIMTVTTAPAYRAFSTAESSAIQNLHIEQEGYVEVIFQSNPNRAYGFIADPTFCADLIDIISYSDLRGESLGRVIAQARKNGNLEPITEEV